MMDINVDGTWLFCREAGQHMLQHHIRGSIILIASMSGTICVRPQKQAAYNTSKSAVKMLAKSLATEWAPHGIRVNSLSPGESVKRKFSEPEGLRLAVFVAESAVFVGYIYTDLIKNLLKAEGELLYKNWVKDIPLGRMGEPRELQGAAVWMASEASSYLTGSDIVSICLVDLMERREELTDGRADRRWRVYCLVDFVWCGSRRYWTNLTDTQVVHTVW